MQVLFFVALAPIFLIGLYLYRRDKYEREPVGLLFRALLAGGLSVIPILFLEIGLSDYWSMKYGDATPNLTSAAYEAFVVASFSEELFKYIAVMLFFWRNRNFNERMDGIVYAAFVSLGFAMVENVLYVFQNGMPTGILRAFTAVPLHAVTGITMGFFLGFARMSSVKRTANLIAAFVVPFLIHGVYDFMLMSEEGILLLLFIPFVVFMIIYGTKRISQHADNSPFKPDNQNDNINTTAV